MQAPATRELRAPPRRIPFGVRFALAIGPSGIVAWGMTLLSAWVAFGVAEASELKTSFEFSGPRVGVVATVDRVEPSGVERDQHDWKAIRYTYEVSGQRFEGVSYVADTNVHSGGPVDIEYVKEAPSVSRVLGSRRRLTEAWTALLPLFFTVLGLGFGALLAREASRRAKLLESGRLGRAHLAKVTANEEGLARCLFVLEAAQAPDDLREAWIDWARTHPFAFPRRVKDLTEDEHVPVLYEPREPGRAIPLAWMPVRVGPEGEVALSRSAWWLAIALPLALLGSIAYFAVSLTSVH